MIVDWQPNVLLITENDKQPKVPPFPQPFPILRLLRYYIWNEQAVQNKLVTLSDNYLLLRCNPTNVFTICGRHMSNNAWTDKRAEILSESADLEKEKLAVGNFRLLHDRLDTVCLCQEHFMIVSNWSCAPAVDHHFGSCVIKKNPVVSEMQWLAVGLYT